MAEFRMMRSWRPQVAIDLGTAFIRVATERCEVQTISLEGSLATPLRSGVVTDPHAVADILRPCLEQAKKWSLLSPRVVVGAPSDLQDQERALLRAAMHKAGAGSVDIVAEPRAAALGAAIDFSSPYAQMIVDMGEGVTDCAIFRAGELLASRAVRLGCADLRDKVRADLVLSKKLDIDNLEAARMVQTVGVVGSDRGHNLVPIGAHARREGHAPLAVCGEAVQAAMEPVVVEIVSAAADLLRMIPHELGCEIIESGIVLSGGGALVPGMSKRVAQATSIQVKSPPNALEVVILGLKSMLQHRKGSPSLCGC